MSRIENGFPGERFVVLPQPFLDLMEDNPLTGDLYIHSLGHMAHALHHHVSRPNGIPQYVFLYCTWGRGSVEIAGTVHTLSANRHIILPAGVAHRYFADTEDPWTLYWAVFAGGKAKIFAHAMSVPVSAHRRCIPARKNGSIFSSIRTRSCAAD